MGMEGHNGQEEPKRFTVFEQAAPAAGNKKEPPIEQRGFDAFPDPHTDRESREKALELARRDIVENEKLYEAFVKGVRDKGNGGEVQLARIQNALTKRCVDLSDEQIDSVIRQFTHRLGEWYSARRGEFGLDERKDVEIRRVNGSVINADGVKSVVRYLRARSAELSSEGAPRHMYCFENSLDAHYKIDVVEMLYRASDEGVVIDEMNAVQIKNSIPSEEAAAAIESDHKEWALEKLLSYRKFMALKLGKEAGAEARADAGAEASAMQELLIDLMTSPEEVTAASLAERLKLGGASAPEKAAIVFGKADAFRAAVDELVREGYADQEWKARLDGAYGELAASLSAKIGIPAKRAPIRRISSSIVVNGKTAKKTSLYERGDGADGAFAAYA